MPAWISSLSSTTCTGSVERSCSNCSSCDCSGARCQTLEFLAGWTPANSITLDELNAWNATKRFVFGYRDKDLNLWVQTDIDIGSGGVWEEVTASLARWEDGATDFKGFIDRGGTLQ